MKTLFVILVLTVSQALFANENLFKNPDFKPDEKYGLKFCPWASNSDLTASSENGTGVISGIIRANVFQLVQPFHGAHGKYMISVLYKSDAPVDMVRLMRFSIDADKKYLYSGTNITKSGLPSAGEWKKLIGTIEIPEKADRTSIFFQVRGKAGTKVFFSRPMLQKVEQE